MATQPAVAAHQTKVAKSVGGNIHTTLKKDDFSIRMIIFIYVICVLLSKQSLLSDYNE